MNRTVRLAVAAAAAAVLLAGCGGAPAETVAAVDPGPSPSAPRHTPTATTEKADPVWYREVCSTLGQMSAAAARSDQAGVGRAFDFLMATRAPVEVSIAATESCPEHRALAQEYRAAAGGTGAPAPSAPQQPLSPYRGSPDAPPGYGPVEPLPSYSPSTPAPLPARRPDVSLSFAEEVKMAITIGRNGATVTSDVVCRKPPAHLVPEGYGDVRTSAKSVRVVAKSSSLYAYELSARVYPANQVEVTNFAGTWDADNLPDIEGTVLVEVTCGLYAYDW